jgi:hypothetical protein
MTGRKMSRGCASDSCRSGRKWKHCHLGCDKQPRPNIDELLNVISQDQARGYSVPPDADTGTCSGGLTGAHTIQKGTSRTHAGDNALGGGKRQGKFKGKYRNL